MLRERPSYGSQRQLILPRVSGETLASRGGEDGRAVAPELNTATLENQPDLSDPGSAIRGSPDQVMMMMMMMSSQMCHWAQDWFFFTDVLPGQVTGCWEAVVRRQVRCSQGSGRHGSQVHVRCGQDIDLKPRPFFR